MVTGVLSILDLPADQRPRERLLRLGTSALTDAELVAVLLSGGRPGENALQLAHRLLHAVGGVAGLGRTRPDQLVALSGVGPAKAARLAAALALPARSDRPDGDRRIHDQADLAEVARPMLTGLHRERLVVVVCDRRLRVRHVEAVSDGASDRAVLPVRDVLRLVLRHDGHAFGVAHNHPSGDPAPSRADRQATHRLRFAAAAAELRFVGHVVVCGRVWRPV
jgi:DNA repair protein RadC